MGKPIVVGIDSSPDSAVALDWAITQATRRGDQLMILHVDHAWSRALPRQGSVLEAQRTHGQEVVEQAHAVVRAANRDISVSSLLVPGEPADVLISWSADASMLVLGTSGQTRLGTAVLAAAADRHSDVPAWVVSSTGGANDVLSYESMTAQLIVTGSHGHGLRSGLLLGSVSQALLHTASCSLAIIPAKQR